MRIVHWNYAFDPSVLISASSSDSEFPVSNLRNHSRGKVWRSAGYFLIDSTNKYLDFDEGGSELNAELTVGAYTPATLAAEIKTQLDATGSDTYTVSYSSSTGKWTIASDGSTFNILWSSGTNTANSIGASIGFDTSSDDSSALTYTGASIAIHTSEWILFDLRTWGTNPIDSLALIFDALNGVNFSDEVVLKWQANQTPNFSSPAVDQAISLDEDFQIVTHFFASAQNYRYHRLYIEDAKNADLYIEIPKVFFGLAETALTRDPEIGFVDENKDLSTYQENGYGVRYPDIYPNRRMGQFAWLAMEETEKQALREIYSRVGNSVPILVSLDPLEATFANKDEHVLYAFLEESFKASQQFLTYFDFSMMLTEAM